MSLWNPKSRNPHRALSGEKYLVNVVMHEQDSVVSRGTMGDTFLSHFSVLFFLKLHVRYNRLDF